jgi:hypothetical protein
MRMRRQQGGRQVHLPQACIQYWLEERRDNQGEPRACYKASDMGKAAAAREALGVLVAAAYAAAAAGAAAAIETALHPAMAARAAMAW